MPGLDAANWAFHELASRALGLLLAALDREGIEALPVKGILLAKTLYADTAERPMADVDLRICAGDLPRVVELCRARGWVLGHGSKQWGTIDVVIDRILVEIETTIGPPGVCAVTVGEMIERATRRVAPLGFSHLEPELHDHALVLCVNLFKDKLCDSAPCAQMDLQRIARLPGFNPAEAAMRAHAARLKAAVWIVADWVAQDAGSEEWAEVRDRIGRVPPRPGYVRAYQTLAREPRASRFVLPLIARAASDDAALRARALLLGSAGTLAWCWRKLRLRGLRA